MSELGAVIIGFGIGCGIGLPALITYRHDIASSFRRLFSSEPGERGEPGHEDSTGEQSSGGMAPAAAACGIGAGVLTALYGAFVGEIVFLASGTVLVLCTVVALVAAKVVKD